LLLAMRREIGESRMKEVPFRCFPCGVDCQFIASEFDAKAGTKTTEYKCKVCSTRHQITLKGTTIVKQLVMRDGKILELFATNANAKL
jgi:hypothetical protein